MKSTQRDEVVLLPDAGPLITLAYANALDLLFKPGWSIAIVDAVLHEVTRNQTPSSEKIARWVQEHSLPISATKTFEHYRRVLQSRADAPRKSNMGELAIQETMNRSAIQTSIRSQVFLFEDHKIARASFLLPENCRKVSTRAFLIFLEQQGWIDSAAQVERQAVLAGRAFSRLRFPTT